jgi:hypothetical protein
MHSSTKESVMSTATKNKTYTFILILAGVSEITEDMAEALFAASEDSNPWSSGGVVSIGFDREAESLGDAIGSAVKEVEAAGYSISRVDVGAKG